MAVFLLLVLTTVIVTDFLWVYSTRTDLRERILEFQKRTAENAAFRVSEFMQIKVRNLILRSQSSSFLTGDVDTARFDLAILLKQDADLLEVSFIDQDGQELIKLTPDKVFEPHELVSQKESDKFRFPTFRFGLEYLGTVYLTKDGDPAMTISVPIVIPIASRDIESISTIEPGLQDERRFGERYEGEILGVLAAEVNIGRLLRSVAALDIGEEGYIYVTDNFNNLIAHPNSDFVAEKKDVLSADIIKKHVELDEQFYTLRGAHPLKTLVSSQGLSETGVEVLATNLHSGSLKWNVIVQQPTETVFAPIAQIERFAMLLFLVALVFTVIVSFWFSRILTKSLQILRKGTEVIGAGDLSYRLNISTGDEIEQLALAFNDMAEKLGIKTAEFKEARAVAEEERDKTKSIITNFSDGIFVFDNKDRIVLVNPQAQLFFSIDGGDVLGKYLNELSSLPSFKSLLELLLPNLKKVFRQRIVIAEKTLEVTTVPLMAEKERVGMIIIVHDVTREERVERLKSEFVSIVAHQLRTPLSALKWGVNMLIDGDFGKINQKQKDFLGDMRTSNMRMITLVGDLLNLTRMEEGKYVFKKELADIQDVIQNVVTSEEARVKREKLSLQFKKPEERLPKILMDATTIRTVVQNILDNSIRYTHPGGEVTVVLSSKDKKIEVSFQDTGIGIFKPQQHRVFEKFFRTEKATRLQTVGSGLGLFIAKNIVEAHGGKIWFTSKEGEGSTFRFTLPIPDRNT